MSGVRLAVSTGALARGCPADAVELARRAGITRLEASALHESELDHLTAWLKQRDELAFDVTSVHAPAKGLLAGLDGELARIASLAPSGHDVVAHPDVLYDVTLWGALGERLLVENTDVRKRTGQDVDQLEQIFERVPAAGMCLDVSHALSLGDPQAPVRLARAFSGRIRLLHVGCAGGRPQAGALLDDDELDALAEVCSVLGRRPPVVLERDLSGHPDPAARLDVLGTQVRRRLR